MKLRTALLAAAATTLLAGAANAADAIGIVPAPAPVTPVYDSVYNWDGFYAGVSVGAINDIDDDETNWTVGVQAGVNAGFDFFLVGAEVAIDAAFDDDIYAYGSILARAGVLLGDPLLVYGAVGYGSDFGADEVGHHILAGGGLEFKVTEEVSVRGQYLYGWDQADEATTSDIHKFTVGANFQF
jgi:outer membrane immunogenic protein